MRKVISIIVVGIIIAAFPLLALPPRFEMWILFFLGLVIIVFGIYERVADQEKKKGPQPEPEPLSADTIPVANRGEEYRFDSRQPS